MIREVFINNQLVDVESNNAAYIFTSPVFRDISAIMSNRTTTYKLPKTQRNLNVFGLADNPDVVSILPYRFHKIEEYRDGLPFIKGRCALLKSADQSLELLVIWGNAENLLSLKELKLRELNVPDAMNTIEWNADKGFLPSGDEAQKGFIVADFGRGINIQYARPSVTLQYILDLIKAHSGVKFIYPSRFDKVFTKTWVNLAENNANRITWDSDKYRVSADATEVSFLPFRNQSYLRFQRTSGGSDIIGTSPGLTFIRAKEKSTVEIKSNFYIDLSSVTNNKDWKLEVLAVGGENQNEVYQSQLFNPGGGSLPSAYVGLDMSFDASKDDSIHLRLRLVSAGGNIIESSLHGALPFSGPPPDPAISIAVKAHEVSFGDKYPIVPNLPDISVVEYLKSIMHMYGLFTYYDYRLDENTVEFISIDDIYEKKKTDAYDWTDKLVDTNRGRFSIDYNYGDYAQRNYFRYKADDDVETTADGYIDVDNTTLLKSKEIITLPFAPSDNTMDDNKNQYAHIKVFNGDDSTNNVSYRILNEGVYKTSDSAAGYKSGIFLDRQKFSGSSGLLAQYYSAYQYILRYPVVVQCYVYLNEYELHLYRELNPVYIDGTFYAPVKVVIETSGAATCLMIKMPGGFEPPVQ